LQRLAKAFFVTSFILLLSALYYWGALGQLQYVNTDMLSIDQSVYMAYARKLYDSNYTFIGDRNQMPIYPVLQSLFYRSGMSDEQFFNRGKYVNLALSMVLLGALALILLHFFPPLHTLNLMLIVAFTVFVFKAGWFQCELLYYFMSLCLFVLLSGLLEKPSYPLAILTGIVAGLAHLTKASVLPAVVLFLLWAGGQWAWTLLRNLSRAKPVPASDSATPHLCVALLVGLSFLATVFPYIKNSKRVYGQYFYNVNTTFYVWYDSWSECKEGTAAHGDRVGWPDMPPEEIPSMSKYLREHTPQHIVARFLIGGIAVLVVVVGSYGYFTYAMIYMALLAVAIRRHWGQTQGLLTANRTLITFWLAYFAAYVLLYAWVGVINPANRYVLAHFMPLMFVLSRGLCALLASSQVRVGRHTVNELMAVNLMILAVVAVDVCSVLARRAGSVFGGY
jgi:hypothetical protein